jgi:hypothetical protein
MNSYFLEVATPPIARHASTRASSIDVDRAMRSRNALSTTCGHRVHIAPRVIDVHDRGAIRSPAVRARVARASVDVIRDRQCQSGFPGIACVRRRACPPRSRQARDPRDW